MSFVKLRNIGDKPYKIRHAKYEPEGFMLEPGAERITHLGVALLYLGNPAAVNRGPTQAEKLRDAEIKRVHRKWGFCRGLMSEEAWYGAGLDKLSGEPCGPFVPQIEVYDLDDNRMWMIHDDPTGERRNPQIAERVMDAQTGKAMEQELAELKLLVKDLLASKNDGAPPPDPASIESRLGEAMEPDQTQAERNETRDDIPPPPKTGKVGKDKPRTTKSGSRAAVSA